MAGTYSGPTTITACENTTGFSVSTGFLGTSTPGPEGTNYVYHYVNPVIDGGEYIEYDTGAGSTIDLSGTDDRFLFFWLSNSVLWYREDKDDAGGNPGLTLRLASSASDWKEWNIAGGDVAIEENYRAGFYPRCVDPDAAADNSGGTLNTAAIRYIRIANNFASDVGGGFYTSLDYIASGKGLTCTGGGTVGTPLDLTDFEGYCDANGIPTLSLESKVYSCLGDTVWDSSASDLHFNETGKVLFVNEARGAVENEKGIYDTSNAPRFVFDESGVNDTNVVFGNETSEVGGCLFLSDVLAPVIECTAALTKLKFLGCTFVGFDWNISGGGNPTIKNSTLDGCGEVPVLTNTFEGNSILNATSGVLMGASHTSKNNAYAGCTDAIHVSDNGPITITLDGDTFSSNTDDIHFSGTGTLTVKNTNGANASSSRVSGGGTVVIETPVTIKVTAAEEDGTPIQSARVVLLASNASGPFPYGESVTITRSGSTATVTHAAHGMKTDDYVAIDGADQEEYNGVKQITVTNPGAYTFTVSGTPASPATGTITATFAALYGLTDVNGEIETERDYPSNQPVTGWARKSTASPFYRQGVLSGSILSASGYDRVAVMVSDE